MIINPNCVTLHTKCCNLEVYIDTFPFQFEQINAAAMLRIVPPKEDEVQINNDHDNEPNGTKNDAVHCRP